MYGSNMIIIRVIYERTRAIYDTYRYNPKGLMSLSLIIIIHWH